MSNPSASLGSSQGPSKPHRLSLDYTHLASLYGRRATTTEICQRFPKLYPEIERVIDRRLLNANDIELSQTLARWWKFIVNPKVRQRLEAPYLSHLLERVSVPKGRPLRIVDLSAASFHTSISIAQNLKQRNFKPGSFCVVANEPDPNLTARGLQEVQLAINKGWIDAGTIEHSPKQWDDMAKSGEKFDLAVLHGNAVNIFGENELGRTFPNIQKMMNSGAVLSVDHRNSAQVAKKILVQGGQVNFCADPKIVEMTIPFADARAKLYAVQYAFKKGDVVAPDTFSLDGADSWPAEVVPDGYREERGLLWGRIFDDLEMPKLIAGTTNLCVESRYADYRFNQPLGDAGLQPADQFGFIVARHR